MNLFTYTGMMLIDNQILTTSPDYLREKTLRFFGTLGKLEYIDVPTPVYTSQGILDRYFWPRYCDTWGVKKDDVELMNIINFLLNVPSIFTKDDKNITFRNFEKYIGNLNSISDEDLSFMCHRKILELVKNNMNDRVLKLKALGN